MRRSFQSESGFSLIETMIAMLVLTVGAIGMASVFLYGMNSTSSSPNEVTATQKASEAIESVFSARDTHTLTWEQLRNVSKGGVFLDGARNMTTPGPDGIVDTADDGGVETVQLPGPDQLMGTGDDTTQTLTSFRRQISIADSGQNLRIVTVKITYPSGSMAGPFNPTCSAGTPSGYSALCVTVYISSFA